ncbi:MAG: hypothetical protein ACLF0P_12590, partial [Thermoanaerobaculia bacterium]
KYTVWHYVGCGCAVLFVLGLLGVGGCFWMVTNWGRQLESELKDPEARAARAQRLLGYEELPEGYKPGITVSIPFFMDMAMLGDRELPAGEDMDSMGGDLFGERGFMYFKMRSFGQSEEHFREELEHGFRAERVLAEGEIEAGGARVSYVAELGTTPVRTGRLRSVSAEMKIDCGDGFFRTATWFTPVPGASAEEAARAEEGTGATGGPGAEVEETGPDGPAEVPSPESLAGTPADEEALRAFLDHFDLCR